MNKTPILATFAASLICGCSLLCRDCPTVTATSPDGRNAIRLWANPLAYEVLRDGQVVVARTEIALSLGDRSLSGGEVRGVSEQRLAGTAETPVYKKSRISLAAGETLVDFGDWGVRLTARDDGVAYRFETRLGGRVKVFGERAAFTIPDASARCALNYGGRIGCEETVPLSCAANEIVTGADSKRSHVYLPFVYSIAGKHVAVTESDVFDYPIWNLRRADVGEGVTLAEAFAHWPRRTVHTTNGENWSTVVELPSGGRWIRVLETEPYLVETEGTRTFPWRVFVLADAPSAFCAADIVHALARGTSADFSWVKPGKVAWDWWNAWDNKGEKDGCNTAMYKRFIDFAAKAGIEYVILDEGWSEKLNIWKFHPNVDVPAIIRHGREKGVGIILWMAWAQVAGDEERVASHFARLGAKGFKVDFMDRGDADCERFLWKFAAACAKNRMVVDYHGAHHPTGMSRAYPNVLNYEGVHGLECMKFYRQEDFMDNDVKAFFLRMTAGPLDYTPGAMDNYPVGQYRGNNKNPGSIGTRCRQMAMLTLYEAPLQMLCDAPTKYERNAECLAFMAATPVVWDDTIGLGGMPDSFAAVARRAKDGSWFVAGISDAQRRDFVLDTSFLGDGSWKVEVFRDAADADINPMHYVHETGNTVRAGAKLILRMAPGGGFVARFRK